MTDLPEQADRAATGPDGNPSGPVPSGAQSPSGAAAPASPPDSAREIFGAEQLRLAVRYAGVLASEGLLRGLIGPREVPRLWDRHLLNCAVVGELVPDGTTVLDVGSGAGLPGLVLAVARPDLTVILVEPLARRTAFLTEAVAALGLTDRVDVIRGRAEELRRDFPDGAAPVVTARAVAPLDRLAGWCLPLAEPGGRLLALKGDSAAAEISEHRAAVLRSGGGEPQLRHCGERWLDPPTTVVEIERTGTVPGPGGRHGSGRSGRGRQRPARRARG